MGGCAEAGSPRSSCASPLSRQVFDEERKGAVDEEGRQESWTWAWAWPVDTHTRLAYPAHGLFMSFQSILTALHLSWPANSVCSAQDEPMVYAVRCYRFVNNVVADKFSAFVF